MASWKLCRLVGSTYYIPAPANIGLFCRGKDVYLIDSGNDKEAGRQIRKLLQENNWNLKVIINTHAHADHIGGNAYLQKRTGCRIYVPAKEHMLVDYPEFEAAFLLGGYPHPGIKTKFLQAEQSMVTNTYNTNEPIPDTPLQAIPLPGHSFDMAGIRTPDDVLFLADSLLDDSFIEKHPVFFLYDIQAQCNTLQRLETISSRLFVPSHGVPRKILGPLIEKNKTAIESTVSYIKGILLQEQELSFEEIFTWVAHDHNIPMNHIQYVLLRSTLTSYISWLASIGMVSILYRENRMVIQIT